MNPQPPKEISAAVHSVSALAPPLIAPDRTRKTISVVASAAMLFFAVMSGFQTAEASGSDINADYLGTAPGRFNSILATDVDLDGRMEILFSNFDGRVKSIEFRDGDYYDEWQSPQIGARAWGLDAADLGGDSRKEIIAGDGDGNLFVFEYGTAKTLAAANGLGRDVHGIDTGDVDGDGVPEIIAGTGYKTDFPAGKVYIFEYMDNGGSGRLSIKKELAFNESKHRGIAVSDVDGDGGAEIVIGSGIAQGERPGEGYIHVVDGKSGRTEWTSEDLNGDAEGLCVHDLNGDGIPEIIAGTGYRYQEGYVLVFSYDNSTKDYKRVWKSENIGPKVFGLAVGDIDSDGTPEIVAGNQPGYIYVFNGADFRQKWKSPLLGMDVLGITLSDVDSDGSVEIIAAQGGYDGKGDFTSAYTAPHIYIIGGKNYEFKTVLGEIDYIGLAFQIGTVLLFIITMLSLKRYLDARRKNRGGGRS